MVKNNEKEIRESGKMLALTLGLTKALLLAVALGVFWLVQTLLTESSRFLDPTRGFRQF